ncbi:LysR family transcriptional regulator [Rhodococcus sp. ACS1]|uniref:DNA-binding transcriptional regulator, LysR family n=1 Tax=Rhodococcus koreensis TaxID=99653 RepID=A0A1H4WDM6_9NOCA|nr:MULTISPECIES: LysR family transcriptional regulator [Rhodococcus]PBC49925.1 LysR family transcriptional regulator [Rhodococcus sp. ACS1]SEC91385.1 DNA-binding transcriptional regulator, LysR family [Rhodococcus koreensis]
MNIELRHLRALAAIGDEGSITAAAAALHTAQPALSRTLNQLEDRVGTRLVERTTRSLELTAAGRRLWERAHRILQSVDDAIAEATAGPAPLRVGYAWSALGRHTVTLLRTWKDENPDAALVVRQVDNPELALRKGEVDIAFFRSSFPSPDTFEHVLLGYEDRMVAVAEDDSLNQTGPLSLSDLSRRRIALCSTAGTADLDLWPANERPESTVVVANVDEWLTAIATGEAIGLTSVATEYSHPHPGVSYTALPDVAPVEVYLTWPRNDRHPMTGQFVEHASYLLSKETTAAHRAPTGR